MGYLTMAFNKYYYSSDNNEKVKIKDRFKKIVWSSLPYEKMTRYFKYNVSYHNISDEDVIKLLESNKYIEYKVLKSRYNLQSVDKVDLVKARINTNYGKYFDKDVYLKKEYYRALAEYKNIYFNYLGGNVTDLKKEIKNNKNKISKLKKESYENKYDMTWNNYKAFVNMCFDSIFNNYIPIQEKVKTGDFAPNNIMDWDEDNYILVYINKSMNGYLKNYINELKGNRKKVEYVNCEMCNKMVEKKSNRTKYCDECWKEYRNNYQKELMRKIRSK